MKSFMCHTYGVRRNDYTRGQCCRVAKESSGVICKIMFGELTSTRKVNSRIRLRVRWPVPFTWIITFTVLCLLFMYTPRTTWKRPPFLQSALMDSKDVGSKRDVNTKNNTDVRGTPRHHVFFLKVHKAASTTVQNVLLRFALRYSLTVLLPQKGHCFSEKSKAYWEKVLPLNNGSDHYDILCCHLVYNETFVREYMPNDTLFVGIVREPFAQVLSAFHYFSNVFPKRYLVAIPGTAPFLTYLEEPSKWEHINVSESFTNNRMSFDFGLEPSQFSNASEIQHFIEQVDERFDLVMIHEMFDESLVFLKRLAGWNFKDIIYTKTNSFDTSVKYNFTAEHRSKHQQFEAADYALYDHFLAKFKRKLAEAGEDFKQEVEEFRKIVYAVWHFCNGPKDLKYSVHFQATHWSSEFDFVADECLLLKKRETEFIHFMKLRHKGMLT